LTVEGWPRPEALKPMLLVSLTAPVSAVQDSTGDTV
jgi:hypothetical protein